MSRACGRASMPTLRSMSAQTGLWSDPRILSSEKYLSTWSRPCTLGREDTRTRSVYDGVRGVPSAAMRQGKVLHGFREAHIRFLPSYRRARGEISRAEIGSALGSFGKWPHPPGVRRAGVQTSDPDTAQA